MSFVLRHLPVAALAALAATACGTVVSLEAGDPVEFVQQPQTSQILAADGAVLAELHGEQDRRDVTLSAVAPDLVRAVVATEDRRFFLHAGVDVAAIARAAVRNIEVGELEEGGSTITQQYVKNTMTGPARTLERKLREAALAFQLEQRYSKDEILERYLNTVYFGRGAYGVYAGAQRFFGTTPEDLTLPQAALLAGMIASPSNFDPYDHAEVAIRRRGQVLDALVDTGQLRRSRAAEADSAPLDLAPLQPEPAVEWPYVVAEAKRLLQHDPDGRFGVLGDDVDERADRLFTGGLRVHLTLDRTAQSQARAAIDAVLTEPDDPSGALVALDPASGAIRALVGGRDFRAGDNPSARFNLATQARRQAGSAFKPFVLAAALSRGVPLDRGFPGGTCVSFPQIPWEPCNYGRTSYAPMTLREATVRSVNTVFARLAVDIGPTPILEMARTLGFRGDLPQVHALALGVAGVSPLEMAGAYLPFSTLGRYRQPYLIDRIEAADGEVLYRHEPDDRRVMQDSVAYLITQTLQDVVRRGTGVRASIDRPQAGKTGTSQEHADAWFVGYTPDLVASTWVGFPEGSVPMRPPRTRTLVEGGRWPAQIWQRFAEAALADVPPTEFPTPDVALVGVEVDVTRNCLPNPYTPPEVIEIRQFPAGTAPTARCTEPTGPPVDDVPSVTGLPIEVGQRVLEDRGFVVDVRPEASGLYPPGVVTRQRPAPGGTTRPEDGNAVVLWNSISTRVRLPAPDVTGLDVTVAVERLEDEGWVAEVVERCPELGCDDAAAGTVWAQDPAPGETVREHALVRMSVVPDRG